MVLVTGGTGFVGRAVVPELRGAGLPVRVFCRSAPPPGFADDWVQGDVRDLPAFRRAASGCRAVVHLVAVRRQWGTTTFEGVTASGARNAVQAAQEAGCERFVLVSALGLTDRPATGYMRAKAAAEEAVRVGGLAWTILRPSFVVGPGGFVEEYAKLLRRAPVVPIPGSGAYPVQPVARRDVAIAVRRALEVPVARGRTYDLAGPDRLPFEGFIDRIADALGVRKPKVHVPLWFLRPAAALLGRLTPGAPVTAEELTMLLAGNVGDPLPAVRELGIALTPLAEAVSRAVEELRSGAVG